MLCNYSNFLNVFGVNPLFLGGLQFEVNYTLLFVLRKPIKEKIFQVFHINLIGLIEDLFFIMK